MKIAKKIGHEQLQLSVFLGVENETFEQLQQKHPKEPVYVSFEMLKVFIYWYLTSIEVCITFYFWYNRYFKIHINVISN